MGGGVLRLCPTSGCGLFQRATVCRGLGLRSHFRDDAKGLFGTPSFEMFVISACRLRNMFS